MSSSPQYREHVRSRRYSDSFSNKIRRPPGTIKGQKEKDIFSRTKSIFNCVKVFSPDGTFTLLWGAMMVITIIYQMISVPFYLAFESNDTYVTLSLDFICTIIYLGDIGVTMNTSFYKKGMLVVSRRDILKRYLRSWLFIDMISSFPFSWVFQGPLTPSSGSNLRTPTLLKVIKLSRIVRTFRLVRVTKLRQYLTLLEQRLSNRFSILFTVLYLCLLMTTIAHWAACGFYYMSQTTDSVDSWVFVFHMEGEGDSDRYVTALYWAVTTLTTTGYGDIVPITANERMYVIVIMILSAGVFSYLIGKIGTVISLIERESSEHKELVMDITRYLRAAEVPQDVSYRALRYIDYVWETRKRRKVLDKRLLREFSEPLMNEVSEHIFGNILHRVPMMDLFDVNFISQLARGVEPEIYAQDDIIFEMDQSNSEIYFLEKGRVEIYHKDSQHTFAILSVRITQRGTFFGEIAFFTGIPRCASARCLQFSELLSVKRELLLSLMRLSPSASYTLQVIMDRLKTKNFHEIGIECYLCQEHSHIARDCDLTKVRIDRETIKQKWIKKRQTPAKILKLKEKPNVVRRVRKVRIAKRYSLKNVKSDEGWDGLNVRTASPKRHMSTLSTPRRTLYLNGREVLNIKLKDALDFSPAPFSHRGSAPSINLPTTTEGDEGEGPSPPVSPKRRYSILGGVRTYQLLDELRNFLPNRRSVVPSPIAEDLASRSNSQSSSDSDF